MSDESARYARFLASATRDVEGWRDPVTPGVENRREGTLQRILARNAAIEEQHRQAVVRRTVSALTFSIQLAPPVPVRRIAPLQWGQQRGNR